MAQRYEDWSLQIQRQNVKLRVAPAGLLAVGTQFTRQTAQARFFCVNTLGIRLRRDTSIVGVELLQ